MNASTLALDTYNRAKSRYAANKETPEDELLIALWEETVEQAKTIREMALKLSFLEMRINK